MRLRRSDALALDARAATELSRLELPFLPWTSSSLRPAAVLQLLNEVIINRRLRVVELGAGISTIAFAKVLGPLGGRLISVEDDPDWAAIVRGLLAEHGLADVVTVLDAPLVPFGSGLPWFAVEPIKAAVGDEAIDLLLVDGPMAFDAAREMSRLPAWPVLGPHMAARAAIALDDAGRAGEQKVLAQWQADAGFDFSVAMQATGLALCTRGAAFNTAP